ncbi:sensor histidine kinase [Corynebacterium bouchesdurhonense]|uniref:sensor histidine kinase n=1 Tax=Corynebacterium bouchesdurhonense TaxID=1720192 RepID=UPI00082E3E93|nr:histidine kinase [Corynebacterium bouchesdurhonense]
MKTTNRILVLLGVSLHVLVAVLLGVGLAGAERDAELGAFTVALVAAFAGIYLAGTVWFNRGKPVPPGGGEAWLTLVISLWTMLALRSAAFVWLEFPLVMLACFILPSGLGLAISALLLAATLTRTVPVSSWGGLIGPTIGTVLAVFIVYAYKALREETEHYKVLEHAAGVAEERARLSREVHDTMAQGLSSIVLVGRALDKQLAALSGGPGNAQQVAEARATLTTIRNTAKENLAAARQFVADNAPPLEPLPARLEGLARAAEERQRALGRTLRVQVKAERVAAIPEPAAGAIERVVREGLSNIERHSQADQAVITVDMLGTTATVDVYDNGAGIGGDEGFGLQGLRARVAEVGGELTVDGSVLAASIPVERP